MAKAQFKTNAQATATAAQGASLQVINTAGEFQPSKEFKAAIRAYKKARAKVTAAKAEQDAAAEVIKAELTAAGVEEYADNNGHLIFREVETSRINSKALKETLPEIWARFTDVTASRPLKVF